MNENIKTISCLIDFLKVSTATYE